MVFLNWIFRLTIIFPWKKKKNKKKIAYKSLYEWKEYIFLCMQCFFFYFCTHSSILSFEKNQGWENIPFLFIFFFLREYGRKKKNIFLKSVERGKLITNAYWFADGPIHILNYEIVIAAVSCYSCNWLNFILSSFGPTCIILKADDLICNLHKSSHIHVFMWNLFFFHIL